MANSDNDDRDWKGRRRSDESSDRDNDNASSESSPRPKYRRDDDEDDDHYERERDVYERDHRGGLMLALGLIGLLACAPVGIAAWLMSTSDLKAMERGEMDPEGKGLTTAGKVIGIVATIYFVLQMFCVIGYFGVFAVMIGTGKLK
jgi:hypothetical protein